MHEMVWLILSREVPVRDSTGSLNGLLQSLDFALEIEPRIKQGLMRHSPDWFERGRVGG